jgi:Tfp pilus assembly PilM family ATPase
MDIMKISFLETPEFLALPIFGLNISQSSVKLLKLKKKEQGLVPAIFDEVHLQELCTFFTDSDTYSECNELKKALVDLRNKHGVRFVQLSIPEENTYVFRIMVPHDAIPMIDDFISNNMDQYIPLASIEVFFDYKILKSHISDESVPVVVTAIPRAIVEKYTSVLESCGILIVGCEPETHAIARCVIDKGDVNPYIIMYIDEYATKISVVEEGLVQYTQTLAVKTNDIIEKISPETTSNLKDTINKVIIYWFTSKEQHTQAHKIENVILTGIGVDSPELINFFESNLSVNATYANVWKNCFDITKYIPEMSKKASLKYAPCIGLSMFKIK